jgi:diacylglycerol kinase family enzyme
MLSVVMGTVRDVGIGARPFYRAEEEEGKFQAIFMGFGAMRAVANAFQLFRARPFKGLVKDVLCRSAAIKSETPFRYFMDGEIYSAQELEFSVGPVVRIIRQ